MLHRAPMRSAAAVLALVLPACRSQTWRPSMEAVRPATDAEFNLVSHFPTGGAYQRVFIRHRLDDAEARERFPRSVDLRGQREGELVEVETTDLDRYIVRGSDEEPSEYLPWPEGPRKNSAGFILEFDPPLVYLPDLVPREEGFAQECAVRAFNRWGHAARSGKVRRRIWIDGREDVTVAGVPYRDCIRLRSETELRLGWGPRVDVWEYLWLAPGVGEVRRIERVKGVVFPLMFDRTYAYDLAVDPAERPQLASEGAARTLPWRRVAVYVDPLLPQPRVAGAIVQYAEESNE